MVTSEALRADFTHPERRYISQKATTLWEACISHPSQDGVLF
jgi:hypothetical protein